MSSFYETLSQEDKATVDSWAEKARASRFKRDIPPELYMAAKLGYYYGWEALVAFKRGYILGLDDNGSEIKIPYTFEDAVADVRAGEKVRYRMQLDQADLDACATMSAHNKEYAESAISWANKIRKEIADNE